MDTNVTNDNFDFVIVNKKNNEDIEDDEYVRVIFPIPMTQLQSHLAQDDMSETSFNCLVRLKKINNSNSVVDENKAKSEPVVQDESNLNSDDETSEDKDVLKVVCPIPVSKIHKAKKETAGTTSVCIVKLVIETPPNHGGGPPGVSPKSAGSKVNNDFPPPPPPATQSMPVGHMPPPAKSPPPPAPKAKPKKKSIPNESELMAASPNGASTSGFPPEWQEELANLPPWKRAMREKKMREELKRHEEERRKQEEEEAKWAGIPDWKKQMMLKKEKKKQEDMEKMIDKEAVEFEKKLAGMPAWKQEIVRKKMAMEGADGSNNNQ